MLTLSYGYKKPQTGDRGSSLFTALEQNIQRLNDHTHNGTDSAPLPAQSIVGVLQSISSAGWATYGGAPTGFVRQQVTVPAGFDYDTVQISFRTGAGQCETMLTTERISDTQYYLYCNDSTLDVTAVYGG